MKKKFEGGNGAAEFAGLARHAKQRSKNVVQALRRAMGAIDVEIEGSDGVYPFNGGRLTQSEVCRRAGVHKATLLTATHRDAIRLELASWLSAKKVAGLPSTRGARKSIADSAQVWKSAHAAVALKYQLAELEHLELKRQLRTLEAEVARLTLANKALTQGQNRLSVGPSIQRLQLVSRFTEE
ncbi:hypothetical protein [Kinneretia aquatilis]|uniref:hypothetical protein n=1 Tax=Kinneretia aquatilis TaxID=2070761 RepID=UPI00149538A9|nr:hypothetical protein [Paucibacter aquatile]WIV98453.1 hypothetical protein K9V56_002775 [Paucibacter aquatile]